MRMMSIKKIGALALTLIIAAGFLNLDAGRPTGGIRYRASDPRSRQEIGLERRETAKSMSAVVNGMRNILYNDALDAATKMRLIREQASLFGKSEEEIRQMAARKDQDAAAKVRALDEAAKELERKQAIAEANPTDPKAQQDLVQAKAGWTIAQKAMLAAAGAAVLFGTTYLGSKAVGRYAKPGEDSWASKFASVAPDVEEAFKNMSNRTRDFLGMGEGPGAFSRLKGWWSGPAGTEAPAGAPGAGAPGAGALGATKTPAKGPAPASEENALSRWWRGSKAPAPAAPAPANPPAAANPAAAE